MGSISNEIVQKFSGIQNQIWQTVSMTTSETCGFGLTFTNPETSDLAPGELYPLMNEPKLVIQFAFSHSPESSQIVLIDQTTFVSLAAAIKEERFDEVTDAIVAEARPCLEALVQGICVAVGNMLNDAVVATGLSIRFQTFSVPPNIQSSDRIVKTTLLCSSESFSGNITWIADPDTACLILNIESADTDSAGTKATGSGRSNDDSLDILMDIPLQISVELGRVMMVVKDVVELGSGSIIEIDKAAGEPVDVMVNGRTVARGEVVVIEDNFGVRITEILNQQDRLGKLKEVA